MHPYALCSSCGFPIFLVQTEYEIRRAAKFKEINILPEQIRTNTSEEMITSDIFDSLGIEKVCCRMHIATGTRFTYDVYSVNPVLPNSEPEASENIMKKD